jgi:hypothetical protein
MKLSYVAGAIVFFVVGLACLDQGTGILLSVSPCIYLVIWDRLIAVIACVGGALLILSAVPLLDRGLR